VRTWRLSTSFALFLPPCRLANNRLFSSQFNNLTFSPPLVMFSANHQGPGMSKDTVVNAEREGEFCWSLGAFSCSPFHSEHALTYFYSRSYLRAP
jgi:flavin reductase (DIM6/NTAB) family NADH-FMN oxidoreductase RutF